ncbi:MAG: RICIN domain-containing protein [Verrucomicrobiota bacterium JB022]|nr:RICIN domain-containing protein [Verrucomicrobiota bacterium JB022]
MALVALVTTALTTNLQAVGGFANASGGAGGPTVTVTNLSQLTAAINHDNPQIVQVSGTINLGSSSVRFGSNKTIIGVGTNSGFIGNLKGVDESNVIIQNLNFTNPNSEGDGDGLTLDGCTNVFVTHCAFVNCGDGSLDITHGSDYITVSWCKFSYTYNSGHNFVNLIGHSNNNASEDAGRLRVTFHHNWWSTLCHERMPRVRFGRVHTYNNYFNAPGNNYCIRASIQSEVLAQNNYFENISTPYEYYAPNGKIRATGNTTVNCSDVQSFNDSVFTPPYAYSLESPSAARSAIIASAGPVGGGSSGITGVKVIVNRASGRAMDVYEWDNTNGGNIALYDVWGGDAQRFQVTNIGGNTYTIRTILPGNRSLDVWGPSSADGTNVALYDYLGGSNQQFTITPTSGGYYRITPNNAPNSAVDAFGTANGDNVGIWTYWGGDVQQWRFQNP